MHSNLFSLEEHWVPAGQENADTSGNNTLWFAPGLTLLFFVLQLINILHHGMWRDEMQVWSLSQHSHSLGELFYVKRYEAHTDAWYVLVFLTSRLFPNPLAMQLFNLTLATATTYLVARYSPFSRLQKTLIVFGYFLFYEYGAISRDYQLGVLGLFAFCAAFRPGPRKNYLLLGFLLGLMAESNVYSLMIAVCLALMILFEVPFSLQTRASFCSRRNYRLPLRSHCSPQPFSLRYSICAFLRMITGMPDRPRNRT